MATKIKYTQEQVQAQASSLFPNLDPAKLAAIVTAIMGFLKLFLPMFMAIDANKTTAKDKQLLKSVSCLATHPTFLS
jgi:hypothetical protein